jgi:hypothetical protein
MIHKAWRFFREFKIECVVACALMLQGCIVVYNTGSYGNAKQSSGPDPLELYGVRWNTGTSKQEIFRINPSTGDLTKITDLSTAGNTNWNQIVLMGSDATFYASQYASGSGSASGGYGLGSGSFYSVNGNTLVASSFNLPAPPELMAVRSATQLITVAKNGGAGAETIWAINPATQVRTTLTTHAHGPYGQQSAMDHGTDTAYFTGVGAGGGSGSQYLHKLNLATNAISSSYVAGSSFIIAGVKDASTLIIVRWNSGLSRMEVRELNVNTLSEVFLGDLGDLSSIGGGTTKKAQLDANGWVVTIGRNSSMVNKIYAFDISRAELRTVTVPATTYNITLAK